MLIACGASVNFQNKDENTPLHYVNSVEIAKVLIDNGVNLDIKNKNGNFPLETVKSENIRKTIQKYIVISR